MSGARTFQSHEELATRLREVVQDIPVVLLFAYNRTGKTRLSMAFKDKGKHGDARDTLYFNAFTEDLFVWDNDLDGDSERHLVLNKRSRFFDALTELALDETIDGYLKRYADFDFDIDYSDLRVAFRKGEQENIKISRGEQNIFVWCLFMAIAERLLDGHVSYGAYRYIFIDDPVSSLDDNNAISMACDLAKMLRRAAGRSDADGQPAPIKVIISTHHALFFNVMCNELGRDLDGQPHVKHRRYFMQRREAETCFNLKGIAGDVPFFQHIAVLADLQRAADPATGQLYTFHFNALRSVMEKTSAFFGHTSLAFCLRALDNDEDRALFNRALNLLSHGPYAIDEPGEMSADNQQLFRRMLNDFVARFDFALPAPQEPDAEQQATV